MIAVIYLTIVELWFVGLLGLHRADANGDARARSAVPAVRVALPAVLLATAFVAQLRTIAWAGATQVPFPQRYAGLPLMPLDEAPPLFGHTPYWVNSTILILILVETLALLLLYRVLRDGRPTRWATALLVAAGASMVVAALSTRTLTTTDLYLYVGHAHLGNRAYAPPATPFPGEFSDVNRVWGLPMLPSLYGPLWLGFSQLVIALPATLLGQLEAFRFVGLLSFLACLGLLAKLRVSPACLALFALNPAILEQYVDNGHNDIFALAFALAALAVAPRRPWLAVVLGAGAGAAKLPFALLAALGFARLNAPVWVRGAFAAACCALAVAVTLAGSGGAYLGAAHFVGARYQAATVWPLHLFAMGLALAAIGIAILWKRFNPTAAWSMFALSHTLFPWYSIFGLPYAVLEEAFLPLYLTVLPLTALCITTVYAMTEARHTLYVALVIAAPVLLVPALLRVRAGEARPARRRASLRP